ncbi:MAG: GNAT family N-acetyltransferase [Candidatus Omnitrophica bacterium]|nr:GNAT family N-acetyltransferase [Candidatus Omnitrophota bacterium]
MANFSQYQVKRIDTVDKFLALKEEWTDLAGRVPELSIFLTWEWGSVWWKHFGKGLELFVLVARDNAGRLKGIAPLVKGCWPWQYFGLRYIRFLGHGIVYPIDMGVIVEPKESEPVLKVLSEYLLLHRKEWDFLDMKGVVARTHFEKYLSNAGGLPLERAPTVCPVVALTGDWSSFFKGLDRKFRQKLRSSGASIERDHPGQVLFHRVSSVDELFQGFESLVAMRKACKDDTSFHDNQFVAFHQEVMRVLLERDWLRFYELRIKGQTIAAMYCYRCHDVFCAYQAGFDLEWSRYNPGHLLAAHVIREAIAENVSEFNWLGGDQRYKYHWTPESRVSPHFIFTSGVWGRLVVSAYRNIRRMKDKKKRAVIQV